MRVKFLLAFLIGCAVASPGAYAQGRDVAVPPSCGVQVNAKLQQMIRSKPKGYVENVMVCGIAAGTRMNHGGQHGSHHIITLNVTLPNDGEVKVQVASMTPWTGWYRQMQVTLSLRTVRDTPRVVPG